MDLRFYWNSADQRFPRPEREAEPEDARIGYRPRGGKGGGEKEYDRFEDEQNVIFVRTGDK